jgi:hypothetical protein
MAYTNKPNYPSLKKPGVYPEGTDKELGLDNDDLEKFSLGSWEEVSLSNHRFLLSTTLGGSIENSVQDGLENFVKENLFGFAYVDDGISNIKIEEVSDKLKLINYDKKQNPEEYRESSVPVKINFGMDFTSNNVEEVSNYEQIRSSQLPGVDLSNVPVDILSITPTTIASERDGNPSSFWENNNPTLWGERWNIGYLNYKDPGNPDNPEEITPIVLNRESTPFVIKWNTFGDPTSEGGIGNRRYALPNGAYRIEFPNGILKSDYPIKILDRVKLFDYWDHEYTVIDIIGTLDVIMAIQLDVVYPGDMNADAFAVHSSTFGWLMGEDWLDFNAATNKVMYLPAPFELRAAPGQDHQDFTSGNLTITDVAEAYTWGNQNSEVDHRAASQHGGIPVLRSEDMPDGYNIVIRRPKSSEAESNFGFTKLEFEEDDIKTKDGDDELSLFKEPIPRSPRQLSQDIEPALLSKQYSDGLTDNELIGFREATWSGTGTNAIAVSSEVLATNVTMRARHGYYESDLPPERDGNNKGDGKEWSGNLDDNDNDRFPILSLRAPIAIDSAMLGYPTISWKKDSEFVFYPTQESNSTLEFEINKYYKIKFNVRIYRQSNTTDDDYNLKIGAGILDISSDVNDDGTLYDIKALTNTHLETDLGNQPEDRNVWFNKTIYGIPFTNNLTPTNLKGEPYITINSISLNSGGGNNAEDFISNSNHRFYLQILGVQLEEVEITDIDASEILALQQTSLYQYKVLQWGDEKKKLTNEQILNTFYLSWYNTEIVSDWVLKQYDHSVKENDKFIKTYDTAIQRGYFNLTSHVYNTSGLKSIKAIVYRINQDQDNVLETKLITTNILINDGLLKSQDFSIFGGTDFNFLPLSNKEAIIGGLDEDSKYNNSVEKLKKDDNFIQDDYLERQSSRDFIENFNKKLYGDSPGQLDLSTTRMYKKPLDIYDFITDDKQSIVDNNFNINTLPINSFATDIFISNNDCIVDLNPQDIEYLSIQNKTGTADKAILIGDYKVNQPKDGRVQKQGVMETPLLDDTQDKQAF